MFYTWQQTEQAIKHYRNASYRGFNTEEECRRWLNYEERPAEEYHEHYYISSHSRTPKNHKTSYSDTAQTFSDEQLKLLSSKSEESSLDKSSNSITSHHTYQSQQEENNTKINREFLMELCPEAYIDTLTTLLDSNTKLNRIHKLIQGWIKIGEKK